MKKFATLFLSIVLLSSCGPKLTQEMQNSTITYEALSRGFYLNIQIEGNKMIVMREREKKGIEYILKNSELNALEKIFQKIDIENLQDFKGPTEKRFYDGAAIANLSVNYQDQIYTSQSFDHGNPPTEIADFINKIISFTEN